MLKKILFGIRQGETPYYRAMKKIAVKILHFNVPAWRIVYIPLYNIHMFFSQNFRWILQKFYYEPLFKTQCESCGKNLKIDIAMPQLSPNLKIRMGNNVVMNGINSFFSASINKKPMLSIGDSTDIGFQVSISIAERVTIGNNCLIAARVAIMDNSNHPTKPEKREILEKVSIDEIVPVIIEDNVWLGYQSYIGKGVRIGKGSIVGANSVVVKDVPPNSIVLGCPARKVGMLKKGIL